MLKKQGYATIIGVLSICLSLPLEARSISGNIAGVLAAGLTSTGIGYGSYVISKKIYERVLNPSFVKPIAQVQSIVSTAVGAWLLGRYVHDRTYVLYSREAISPDYAKQGVPLFKEYMQCLLISKILDRKIKDLSIKSVDLFGDVVPLQLEEILGVMDKILGEDATRECQELYTWYQNFDQTKTACGTYFCVDAVETLFPMKKYILVLLYLCATTRSTLKAEYAPYESINAKIQELIVTNQVNSKDAQGETALFELCSLKFSDEISWQRRLELIALLLAHGANPDLANKTQNLTPLHLAAKYCFIDIAKKLIEHRARINPLNKQNQTPLDIVGSYRLLDEHSPRIPLTRQLLLEHGGKKGEDLVSERNGLNHK